MNFSESENVQYLDVIIKFEEYLPYKEPSTYAIFYMCMYILLFINIIARNVLYFCIHVRIQKMCPDPTPSICACAWNDMDYIESAWKEKKINVQDTPRLHSIKTCTHGY